MLDRPPPVPFSLCVFCGGALGARPAYARAAQAIGSEIGRRGWTLVYGGASIGLMGILADAALAAGARVVGVIPQFLFDREIAHPGLSALEVVASLVDRKQRMLEISDAFVALPGGVGTLDELFEAWSWTQAGVHSKPSGLLDVAGYYEPLTAFVDRATAEGLIKPGTRRALYVDPDPVRLLDLLAEPLVP